jgi:hypothetical protein
MAANLKKAYGEVKQQMNSIIMAVPFVVSVFFALWTSLIKRERKECGPMYGTTFVPDGEYLVEA